MRAQKGLHYLGGFSRCGVNKFQSGGVWRQGLMVILGRVASWGQVTPVQFPVFPSTVHRDGHPRLGIWEVWN